MTGYPPESNRHPGSIREEGKEAMERNSTGRSNCRAIVHHVTWPRITGKVTRNQREGLGARAVQNLWEGAYNPTILNAARLL